MSQPDNPGHQRRAYRSAQTSRTERRVQAVISRASEQLMQGAYSDAVAICEEALPDTPPQSYQRAELHNCIGSAQLMQKDFDGAFASFTAALAIIPNDPYLWYNRGLAARFVMRFARSLFDLEQAVALEGDGDMAERYAAAAQLARQTAHAQLAQRRAGFSIEELDKQEAHFQNAIARMQAEDWQTAEQSLRQVIALSDSAPQPWTNLGACLMMQRRYTEAEEAYQHALQHDPNNENAQHNLALLAQARASGELPPARIYEHGQPQTRIVDDTDDTTP